MAIASKWDEAKCLSVDTVTDDVFFSDDEIDQFEATEFCNGHVDDSPCPLLQQCLNFALENRIEYGVYGGTTPVARAAILRKHRNSRDKWKAMSEKDALSGLSVKEINEIKKRLSGD